MDERVYFLIFLIIITCIGYSECQDRENYCGQQALPCDSNRQCIRREKWCNGETDCDDRSDEAYCETPKHWWSTVSHKCTEKHFQCDNKQCVPAVTQCDGYEDCKFGSDEWYCDKLTSVTTTVSISTDSNTNGDFGERSTITTTEALSPGRFDDRRTSATPRIPEATTDYYDKKFQESVNEHQITSGNLNYNLGAHQYTDKQYDHQYPNAYYTTGSGVPPNEQNAHEFHTYQGSRPYHRASDIAPTGSFPSNVQQPHEPIPGHVPDHSPPTAGPTGFHQSTLKVDLDAGRSPRDFDYPPPPSVDRFSHQQTGHRSRDYSYAGIYPQSPASTTFEGRDTVNGYRSQYAVRGYQVPSSQHPHSVWSEKQKIVPRPFNFQYNYTERNRYQYEDAIQRAQRWLIEKRNLSYGWGKDTPRALVALSLITNSFMSSIPENNFMKKSLQTRLGIKLLTELKDINVDLHGRNRIKLAQYINALLATCQDPRDFLGKDLVQRLLVMKDNAVRRQEFVNPFIYTTLCLVDANVTENDVNNLIELSSPQDSDERSRDIQILATTALACLHHSKPELRLDRMVEEAMNSLLARRLSDGRFGSLYSTAIAAQALISVDKRWDERETLEYLMRNQTEDGSFGDMLSTYYILPALSGRSLLHLRNTQCEPPLEETEETSCLHILNQPGPKIRVFYTLKIGYPPTYTIPTYVSVPPGTSFFNVMCIAEKLNSVFKFQYKKMPPDGKIDVYTISNIPDDAERGFYWHLYLDAKQVISPSQETPYTGDIAHLYPEDGQELVYWYF